MYSDKQSSLVFRFASSKAGLRSVAISFCVATSVLSFAGCGRHDPKLERILDTKTHLNALATEIEVLLNDTGQDLPNANVGLTQWMVGHGIDWHELGYDANQQNGKLIDAWGNALSVIVVEDGAMYLLSFGPNHQFDRFGGDDIYVEIDPNIQP